MTLINTPDMNISGFWGTYYSLGVLFTTILSLTLGIFILVKGYKERLKIYWFLLTLSVGMWAFFIYLWSISTTYRSALIFNRIANYSATFIAIFVIIFTEEFINKPNRIISKIGAAVGSIIFILSIAFPKLYLPYLVPKTFFKVYPDSGIVFWLFTLFFTLAWVYSMAILFNYLKETEGIAKKRTTFIFIGLVVSIVGGATNFFPVFNINIFPFGSSFTSIYIALTTYAIIRYRAFEIDTVIHRTILWFLSSCSILIPIGILLFFTRSWLTALTWIQLTFITTGLFYIYLFYYRKTQPRIDHFFRRRKYDYYQVLGEIGQKIGSELDINNVVNRLFKELKEVLYIRNGLILVQQPGQQDYVEAGVIGYDAIIDSQKAEKVTLRSKDALSQWLKARQRALEREQVEVDPQYEPVKEEALTFLNQNSIEILIPVIMEDKVNALVGIGKKENLQAYTIKDIELLESMGRQIGITIDNALHHEDIVEKERLAEELKLGREIQTALLPHEAPFISGLTVQGLMQPAKEIGGDYYDFITLPSVKGEGERLSIVIGDVSGKGVAAGLLMAMAKTAIHTLSQEQTSPREILLRTNAILNKHIGGQKFMTLLYLMWQADTRTFTYSSAGHEHILIYRETSPQGETSPSGKVESILSGGFMLGMVADIDKFLEERQIQLQSGDKILLYTDGVTEAQNQAEDRFGLERLKESFLRHSAKNAQELMGAIKDEVYTFIGTQAQYDDITLVVLEAR